MHPVAASDHARFPGVEECKDLPNRLLLSILGHTHIRRIIKAICLPDFIGRPNPRGVVVVERKEGAGVEGIDVVLLYLRWSACDLCIVQ